MKDLTFLTSIFASIHHLANVVGSKQQLIVRRVVFNDEWEVLITFTFQCTKNPTYKLDFVKKKTFRRDKHMFLLMTNVMMLIVILVFLK